MGKGFKELLLEEKLSLPDILKHLNQFGEKHPNQIIDLKLNNTALHILLEYVETLDNTDEIDSVFEIVKILIDFGAYITLCNINQNTPEDYANALIEKYDEKYKKIAMLCLPEFSFENDYRNHSSPIPIIPPSANSTASRPRSQSYSPGKRPSLWGGLKRTLSNKKLEKIEINTSTDNDDLTHKH